MAHDRAGTIHNNRQAPRHRRECHAVSHPLRLRITDLLRHVRLVLAQVKILEQAFAPREISNRTEGANGGDVMDGLYFRGTREPEDAARAFYIRSPQRS